MVLYMIFIEIKTQENYGYIAKMGLVKVYQLESILKENRRNIKLWIKQIL